MKYLLPLLLVMCLGCQRKQGEGKAVTILHGPHTVALADVPNGVKIVDNIDMVPVLFQVTRQPLKVYIKTDETEPWVEIQSNLTNQPTYIYDVSTQQLRFKWCYEGWGIAVDLQ